ncbi:MAG: NADPH:quinone oxidoreductase family protein [Proteobacteria bacterium]|nr:NADPH:quinone oxidoreductase family protein [Pseudomonadota bacterium]
MRALVCERWCEFKDLQIRDIPEPELRPGCVLLRVAYAGLGFSASLFVAGKYQHKPPLPFVPGTEATGVVVSVAPGVTRVKPGDRVVCVLDWGGFADLAVCTEETLYPLPRGMALAPALHLATSYTTAYAGLIWRARLQPGETLLVHGAAGGVGLAAVEVGKLLKARVIACASSEEKRVIALEHGADVALGADEFREQVNQLTGGRGADVIFDPVGGDVFDQSLRCIAFEGRILPIGFAGGRVPQIPANILLVKNISALGLNLATYIGRGIADERKLHAPRIQAMMAQLIEWMQSGQIRPTVVDCFELSQFVEAMDTVLGRRSVGKVAFRLNEPVG